MSLKKGDSKHSCLLSGVNRSLIPALGRDLASPSDARDACEVVRDFCSVETRSMAAVSKIVIISLAAFHLIKEFFQLTQVGRLLFLLLIMIHPAASPFKKCLVEVRCVCAKAGAWVFYHFSSFQNGLTRTNFEWVRKELTFLLLQIIHQLETYIEVKWLFLVRMPLLSKRPFSAFENDATSTFLCVIDEVARCPDTETNQTWHWGLFLSFYTTSKVLITTNRRQMTTRFDLVLFVLLPDETKVPKMDSNRWGATD